MDGDSSISALGLALYAGLFAASAGAAPDPDQSGTPAIQGAQLIALAEQHRPRALELFREFLSLPNDAHHPDDITRLIAWMEPQFRARGFATRQLATAGNPTLYAERPASGAKRTVLVYLQSDGQPVDPTAWQQPDPFVPVLKQESAAGWTIIPWSALDNGYDPDWRVFARSAADSKGPMTQFLVALDLLAAADAAPAFNLKVIIDTEEELGSPYLSALVAAHRDLLAADMLLIFDGPPHASNRPTVSFGARGMMTLTLTTYGPRVPQHSGHYGNFIPNPAWHLSHILASMKSMDGRVLIPGFYSGVKIDDATASILQKVPDDPEQILADIGVAAPDRVGNSLQEALQYPSLNIRGLGSAWIGEQSRTIIPDRAVGELDIRLVVESDPDALLALVRDHIANLGYTVLDHEPTGEERRQYPHLVQLNSELSYRAFRSDFDAAPGKLARAGMRRLFGHEPILIRTMGGSIPIAPFVELLGIPAATVPTVNIDNNQHSPNENLRLGNFVEGVAIIAAVLSER